jgi:hypothetical protein
MEGRSRPQSHRTAGRDEPITAVLLEIAALSRRIGRRAADLARLAEATRQPAADGDTAAARDLAAAAAEVAAGAAAVTTLSRTAHHDPLPPSHRATPLSRRGRRSRPAAGAAPQSPAASTLRRLSFARGPIVVSSVVHVVAIIALSLFVLRSPVKRPPIALEFGTADAAVGGDVIPVDLTPAEPAAADADAAAAFAVDLPVDPPPPTIDAELSADPLTTDALADDPADVSPVGLSPAGMSGTLGSADLLADVGGGGGVAPGGGRAGTAPPAGAAAATFFGRSGQGKSVCFLCDNSSSYRDGGFHMVLEELARAVDGLRPDQSFFVVFFSDAAYPLFHPAPANTLAPATPDNKRKLRAWLETVEMCRGGQGIHDAVTLAGAIEPDVVYLLSDGEMAGSVVDRVSGADFGAAIVHTFGIQQPIVDRRTGRIDADRAREQEGYNRNLATIAAAHGGGFTPVIVPPPAAALERLRPIARNRSRGPVWGLRL